MPDVKISHVVSFSSEDSIHVADNLLKKETIRKWNCAEPGEKTAAVILQLQKATKIDGIDIGNDGSAFVEVLVGRSGSKTSDEDYQVLLVTSSFMSPSESKSSSNTNRVRMFGKESLSNSTVDQKWDRVKVICTQPYNKNIKYGLVFVRLHGPSDEADTSPAPKHKVTLGAFKLRDDTDSGGLHVGSMFESQKTDDPPKLTVSVAASARAASASSDPGSHVRDIPAIRPMASAAKPVVLSKTEDKSGDRPPAKRLRPESGISDTALNSMPFNNIMKGVRFALSGFKNPYRGQLRDKALAMGAKYEPDWGPSCTHLMCAFPNTPKFNQVKAERGMGVIVRQEWIVDCHKRRTWLPASRYAFSQPQQRADTSSDSESDDAKPAAAKREHPQTSPAKQRSTIEANGSESKQGVPSTIQGIGEDEGKHDELTDEMSDQDVLAGPRPEIKAATPASKPMAKTQFKASKPASRVAHIQYDTDSEDTDDEIRRIQEHQVKRSVTSAEQEPMILEADKGDASVDEEGDVETLPDLFTDQHFLLYGDFDDAVRRRVVKYIIAYNGCIEDYMNDSISYVISASSWNDDFDSALADNASLSFVKPQWIFACHECQKLMPYQRYAIVPM